MKHVPETRAVKKILTIICLWGTAGCNSPVAEGEETVSTLDSNTLVTADSVPLHYDTDNPYSDSFKIAMDSLGPMVTPADTAKK